MSANENTKTTTTTVNLRYTLEGLFYSIIVALVIQLISMIFISFIWLDFSTAVEYIQSPLARGTFLVFFLGWYTFISRITITINKITTTEV